MPDWYTSEERTLRALYPTATKDEICAAIPNHTWKGIKMRAKQQGLRLNTWKPRADDGPPLHPSAQVLVDRRRYLRLSQTELAGQIADINRANVCKVERGGPLPGLKVLLRWCAALDLELVIQPTSSLATTLNAADLIEREARP